MKFICKSLAVIAVCGLLFAACDSQNNPSKSGLEKTVTSIEVTTPPDNIHYKLNDETLDLTGMVITAWYNDGTSDTVADYTYSGFNTASAGNKEITVSYGGKTDKFSITVSDPLLPDTAKPVANPQAGLVASGTTVTLSTDTAGAEIWYTVNGSTPVKNGAGSIKYTTTTPIPITADVTIKAVAFKDNMNDSETLTAAYIMIENGYAPDALDSVPDDWQNDLWLQYEFKELKIGDTAEIYPRRIPEAVVDLINNDIYYPNFNYEIVQGSGVVSVEPKTIDAAYNSFGGVSNPGATHKLAAVTALKTGVAIVKVTYDEYTHPRGTVFGASSAINSAYVAYSVTDGTSTGISIGVEPPAGDPLVSRLGTGLRHPYDTVYFAAVNSVTLPINPTITGATNVAVTCNGALVQKSGGLYNLPLKNTQNIVGIRATNSRGQNRYYYEMINARKIEVITSPTPTAGQEFTVSFKGLTMPIPKMAGIYNPVLGTSTTVNYTSSPGDGTHKGGKSQWGFAEPENNGFNVTFTSAGTYTFTDGSIKESWFGRPLGYEKTNRTTSNYEGNAPQTTASFMLPDFTVRVRTP